MTYTPINELPAPPAFMLEELECEERAYNSELMARIFTIREARPIRIVFRKKLQTHPVAEILTKTYFPRYDYTKEFFITKTLPKDEQEKLKNQTGKNKGDWNKKRRKLACYVFKEWKRMCKHSNTDRHYKCGFLNFYRYNMEQNSWGKDKMEDWQISLPAMCYN